MVSWLLPRRLHQHFYNVYAYCRWADDLADEVADPARALELLNWWEQELDLCYAGRPSHPVFIALAPTIRACEIPGEPFRDLLKAFRQDQHVRRYDTWDEVLGYCRYSANPVGRLVLYLCGYRDAERQRLSDATCTALQLANFWQDVSRDLPKGRIYIPADLLRGHGLSFEQIEARRFDARYVSLMKDLIARTRQLFAVGAPLADHVDPALRVDIRLFTRGGMAVLDAIESVGCNTLEHRPSIGSGARAGLIGRVMAGRLWSAIAPAAPPSQITAGTLPTPSTAHLQSAANESVEASYAECRRVARAAASNFYYAFYMLPRPKRDALCALYAFMRLVDDVSDAPSGGSEQSPTTLKDLAEKRAGLARWRALLDQAVAGDTGGHSDLAGLCRHRPALQNPAALFPRPDLRRGNGPHRIALCHI